MASRERSETRIAAAFGSALLLLLGAAAAADDVGDYPNSR
jgi:hypothetical protein